MNTCFMKTFSLPLNLKPAVYICVSRLCRIGGKDVKVVLWKGVVVQRHPFVVDFLIKLEVKV